MAFTHILVATDFGDCSTRALDAALEIAQKFDARVTLVHVWEMPTYSFEISPYMPNELWLPIEQAAQSQLTTWCETLKARWPKSDAVLRTGTPWHEVLTAAEGTHADLIVVGTHGRTGLSRVLLGSVAERVVRLAKVPVLTVHGPPS